MSVDGMSAIDLLHNRIDLTRIPFTDRGSRLLLFLHENAFSIRLAERWVKWEQEVGHYRQRPPIITDFVICNGNVAADIHTDSYPHLVQVSSAMGHFNWVFVDAETMLLTLPTGRFQLEFVVHADTAQTDRRGGTLKGKRNIAYTTNAVILQNKIAPLVGDTFRVTIELDAVADQSLLLNITPRLGFNRSIPDPEVAINEALQRWEVWFNAAPPVLEKYRQQYYYAWWIMRAGLLNQRYYFTREALTPSKIHYVGVWHWDQFFHAIAYRHIDTKLAEDQIRILIDHQQPDGMFPDAIHDEGLVTHLIKPVEANVTKPPLMAWTVLKLYEKSGHLDFLQEVYEPLVRWHNWWIKFNLDENGLCYYRHPFSSGLDDSPLWDEGMPVVAPDLNTYLCIQHESLAHIADLIGETADAEQYRAGAKIFADGMMEHLWDEQTGVFRALYEHKPVEVLTPFHLLPMWTGYLPDEVINRLIEHLTNPSEFWTEYPLPTVSVSDPKFDPLQMWRGPTWVNINYLFIEALDKIGQNDLARELRQKTLNLLMQHEDIYEYYHPITADHPPKAAPIFGWSSAVFIDLAIQESKLSGL